MAKKIFIISSVASGSGYAVKFTAQMSKTSGQTKVHTLGAVRALRKMHKIDDVPADKVINYLDTKVFQKHSDKYANIVTGWKVPYYLDALYNRYGNEAAFIFVRHAPETAELFTKKMCNKLSMRMNKPFSLEELTTMGTVLNNKIDKFMTAHNLTWVTVGDEPFNSNLTVQADSPSDKWLEMTTLKGLGY
jgi:hypothetical protein